MTALLSFVRPQKITAKIGGDFQLGGPERDRTVDLSDANRTPTLRVGGILPNQKAQNC